MERSSWVCLDSSAVACFLYLVPGNSFIVSDRIIKVLTPGKMVSGQIVPFFSSMALGIVLAFTASISLSHRLRPDFPTVCHSSVLEFFSLSLSFQVLSLTLVLHLALPEELTLPLVLLLAIIVVFDLPMPLGPLLYSVSTLKFQKYLNNHSNIIIILGDYLRSLPSVWTPTNYWNSHSFPYGCSPYYQVYTLYSKQSLSCLA